MGKNRHSKDKLYIVASEYNRDWGGCKKKAVQFRCLPFYCCGLSLLPFTVPVCTSDGIIFDADNIIPYIEKYHRNPVTGKPLAKKDLVALHFHKNRDAKFHCPVTFKEFNEHSHIVANRKSGNVYSNDAIDALCRRPKNWVDFITNEPFCASDLITIQNPHDSTKRQIEDFDYIKTAKTVPISGVAADEGSLESSMRKSELSLQILEESKQDEEKRKEKHNKLIPNVYAKKKDEGQPANRVKHSLFTTSRQAASFTSTVIDTSNACEFRDLTDREFRFLTYAEIKKRKLKGYVRLVTDVGILNFELHCDKVGETCDNFLRHCESGYYNNTIFHRSIPNFMIQGGDPTGTGSGGESAFEDSVPFPDEYHPHLVHKGSGVLSMANSGKNTNKSQFFVTYKSCEHLNNKHSVFGRLVGGAETLQKMEQLSTVKDRPVDPPKIIECIVFKNPFSEYLKEQEDAKIKAKEEENKSKILAGKTTVELLDPMQNHTKRHVTEVGKYTNAKRLRTDEDEGERPPIRTDEHSSGALRAMIKKSRKNESFSSW